MASATSTNQQLPCPKEKLCAVCKKHDCKLSTCDRCHGIWYCSKACQTADWSIHKLLCKAYSQAIRPQAPGKEYRRIIFFHPDKRAPEIQWREFPGDTDYLTRDPVYDLLDEGKRGQLIEDFTPILNNPIWPIHPPNFNYNYELQIERRKYADIDGFTPNQGLAAAVRGLGKRTPIPWFGPVIVTRKGMDDSVRVLAGGSINLCFPGHGDVVEDITMADFRCFVEWAAEYWGYQEAPAFDPISMICFDFMRWLVLNNLDD